MTANAKHLFAGLFLALLALSWPAHLQSGDNLTSIATAKAIVTEGTMLIDERYQAKTEMRPAVDVPGKTYSRFGIGLPLLYVPVALTARIAGHFAPPELVEHILFSALPACFGSLLYLALFRIFRTLGSDDIKAAFLAFVSSVFTITFRYAVYDHSEIIQACLFAWALLWLKQNRRVYHLAGFGLLAFAVMIKAYNIVLYAGFTLFACLQHPRQWKQSLLSATGPLILTGALVLSLNHIRYGSVWESGYGSEVAWFSLSNLWQHGPALLFSGEMGVFTFSPLLILSAVGLITAFPHHWRLCSVVIGTGLFLWLLSACFYEPKGAWSLGPRYTVPSVPLLCLGLAFLNYRSSWIRAAFAFLLIPAAMLSPLYVLQKTQEYDVIRFVQATDHTHMPSQISGLATVLFLKATGHDDQIYPASAFTHDPEPQFFDLRDYQSYRGVNTWYGHLADRTGIPLRQPLLILHLALFAGALLATLTVLLRGGLQSSVAKERPPITNPTA